QGAYVQVVLQVGAHAGTIEQDVDAVPAQFGLRADARQHQQLRRVDRAAAEDHLAPGPVVERAAAFPAGHAGRAPAVEGDALDHGAGAHGEVRARPGGVEVSDRGGAARAVALGDLVQADAELRGAVEV